MAGTEGYCVKCKAKRMMADAKEVAMKGKCTKCGTTMFRIMGAKKK